MVLNPVMFFYNHIWLNADYWLFIIMIFELNAD